MRYGIRPKEEDSKKTSTGGSTDYYTIPEGATELRHLIQYKDMDFAIGNIFKACYRLGEKEGNDLLYDIRKMVFFGFDELEKVSGPEYGKELVSMMDYLEEELRRVGYPKPELVALVDNPKGFSMGSIVKQDIPYVPKELLEYLDGRFPNKLPPQSQAMDPTKELYLKYGERRVVQHLQKLLRDQERN